MNRIISIFLIVIIILNSIIFGVIYIGLKGKLKNDFLNSLNEKVNETPITKVTSLDLSSNSDITMMDNDELKIGNEYFDIYKTEIVNGIKIYYCISDKNEDFLSKAFSDFIFSSTNASSGKVVKTFVKLVNIIGFPIPEYNNKIIPHYKTKLITFKYELQEVSLKILTPPPETFFS